MGRRPASLNPWGVLALVPVCLLVAAIAYSSLDIEFHSGDTFRHLDVANRSTWSELGQSVFNARDDFHRPLYDILTKVVLRIAGGPDQVVFRLVHAGMLLLWYLLLWALVRPRTAAESMAFLTGVACFTGLHTSHFMLVGTPLNECLMVTLCVFAAYALLNRRPGWGVDVAAFLLSLTAPYTQEAGLLVPLLFVAGFLFGAGAVTRRTVAVSLVPVAIYASIRMFSSAPVVPGWYFQDTGFLAGSLDPAQQEALFGRVPVVMYLYNIAASLATVFFSEPRAGVVALLNVVADRHIFLWQIVNVVTSIVSTGLIALWMHRAQWTPARRALALTACAVIVLNAGLGYLYTRDRIVSAAGASYALLLALAVTDGCRRWRSDAQGGPGRVVLATMLAVAMAGWTVRGAGGFSWLNDYAWEAKREWAAEDWRAPSDVDLGNPGTCRLLDQLRSRARARTLDPASDPARAREPSIGPLTLRLHERK